MGRTWLEAEGSRKKRCPFYAPVSPIININVKCLYCVSQSRPAPVHAVIDTNKPKGESRVVVLSANYTYGTRAKRTDRYLMTSLLTTSFSSYEYHPVDLSASTMNLKFVVPTKISANVLNVES
ncbi:hypothetical protein HZH66_005054 [Vespula vulgaris]|uniref:Uncharacterized protein n=1 Tax=Vespula vulgaris TaxID=7454 RepID=A0A834K9W2_VESVU|nr:hypothetical protein HZH66_005054 [Vespula vulgaris]